MHYPLRTTALATATALILVLIIPHEPTRIALGVAWALQCLVLMLQCGWLRLPYIKNPPLSAEQRRAMMAWHIDRGLELARDEGERAMLLAWVNAKLDD